MASLGGEGDDSDKVHNIHPEISHLLHMCTEISDQQECAQVNVLFQKLLLGAFEIIQDLYHVLIVVLCVLALSFANAVGHQGKLTCYFDYVSRLISTYVEDSTSYASFGFNWEGQHRYRLGLMQGRGDIPIKTSCSEPSQYSKGIRY